MERRNRTEKTERVKRPPPPSLIWKDSEAAAGEGDEYSLYFNTTQAQKWSHKLHNDVIRLESISSNK